MKERILGKGMVVGVILLFIGISIQPAIAGNPINSDNEDDCIVCPKSSKQHFVRFKMLLNKVEALNNKLSAMFKLNPEVAKEYQKLSYKITLLTKINEELKPDILLEKKTIICNIISAICDYYSIKRNTIILLIAISLAISLNLLLINPLLYLIIPAFLIIILIKHLLKERIVFFFLNRLWFVFECWYF